MWGVPAGKLEQGETPEVAARRELLEETGIQLTSASRIAYLETLYIRKPDLDLCRCSILKPLMRPFLVCSSYFYRQEGEVFVSVSAYFEPGTSRPSG
jgi:8-oxo-dGTP pyrophosphatase MutT (NUDIX family)